MAAFANFTTAGPALSGAGLSGGAFAAPATFGAAGYGAPVGGYPSYGTGYTYGAGLAGYGAPRPAPGFYGAASYSSSLSGDALAYGNAIPVNTAAYAGGARVAPFPGPVLSGGVPAASSYGGVSGGLEQYGSNLGPQIEAAYEAAALQRRQPVIRRQVIQVPGAPTQVRQVVRRVPTPVPDVIERVFVVKPQRDVVNLVIERPTTPPPQIKNRTVYAKARKPVIHSQVVRVPPRSSLQYQQPATPAPIAAPPAQLSYAAVPAPPVVAPVGYGYEMGMQPYGTPQPYGTGYSYSTSSDLVYPGYNYAGAGPLAAAAPAPYAAGFNAAGFGAYNPGFATAGYGGFGGYSTGYGLPAYGALTYQPQYGYAGAFPYGGYSTGAAIASPYGAGAASAFPGYGTQSAALSGTYQAPLAGGYGSIIAANPAGQAYYGAGYPQYGNFGRF